MQPVRTNEGPKPSKFLWDFVRAARRGYGLRRQLIDRSQIPKGLLGRGERKSLQTDRVILVPGPEKEIEVVQKIYTRFVTDKQTEREIAEQLNGADILGKHGRPQGPEFSRMTAFVAGPEEIPDCVSTTAAFYCVLGIEPRLSDLG